MSAFVAKFQLQDFLFQKWLERPSRASFAPLFLRKPKLRKCNKHEFWVKRGGLGAFVAKFQLQDFLCLKWLEQTSRASFATLFRQKPKLQKLNKHEFWLKRGGLGAFVAKNSTARFFVPKVARFPPGRVSRRCSVENRNSENATNTGFGSNWVDWVRSLRKIQLQVFFVPKVAIPDLPGEFRTIFLSKTKTAKTQET